MSIYFYCTCSHSIMRACWSEDKDSRPTFQELKEEFDGLISNDQRYKYLPLDIDTAEVGITSTKAGVTSTEAGVTPSEEGITSTEAGVTSTEAGVTHDEEGITSTKAGLVL